MRSTFLYLVWPTANVETTLCEFLPIPWIAVLVANVLAWNWTECWLIGSSKKSSWHKRPDRKLQLTGSPSSLPPALPARIFRNGPHAPFIAAIIQQEAGQAEAAAPSLLPFLFSYCDSSAQLLSPYIYLFCVCKAPFPSFRLIGYPLLLLHLIGIVLIESLVVQT